MSLLGKCVVKQTQQLHGQPTNTRLFKVHLVYAQPKWNIMGLPPRMPMTFDKFNQKALVKVSSGAKGWTCGQMLKGTC